MAHFQRPHFRLSTFALVIACTMMLGGMLPQQAFGMTPRGKSTSISTSRRGPEHLRSASRSTGASRRFKVSLKRIATLKKSSFWNKRPYQFASPMVVNGRVFVGVDAGFFYALDARRGKRLWKVQTEGPVHAEAAAAQGLIFVGDAKGVLYAFGEEDGAEKWRRELDTEILAKPLVQGSRLYLPTLSGRLYALDLQTGVEHWHTDSYDRDFGFSVRRASSPTMVGGLILYGSSSGALFAVRESDGSLAWVRQLGDKGNQIFDVDSSPLSYQGRVFAASADGMLYGINPQTGEIEWASQAGGVNDIIVQDGKLYTSGKGRLASVDPQTGLIFWEQDLERPSLSTPVAGDGFLSVVSTTDKVFVIESSTGDVAYERYLKKGSLGDPAIDGQKVYILGNTGRLYSLKVTERASKKRD